MDAFGVPKEWIGTSEKKTVDDQRIPAAVAKDWIAVKQYYSGRNNGIQLWFHSYPILSNK